MIGRPVCLRPLIGRRGLSPPADWSTGETRRAWRLGGLLSFTCGSKVRGRIALLGGFAIVTVALGWFVRVIRWSSRCGFDAVDWMYRLRVRFFFDSVV